MSVNLVATYENIPTGSLQMSTTYIAYAIDYSENFVDFDNFHGYMNVPKYATLEEGRNKLDGTFINLPDDPVGYGYLSTLISDENGDFSDDITVVRTYTMNITSPRNINPI